MLPETTICANILAISKDIAELTKSLHPSPEIPSLNLSVIDLPEFAAPKPLTSQLIMLGLPMDVSQRASDVYMKSVEEFRTTCQKTVRTTCTQLASSPQSGSGMDLKELQQRVFEVYHTKYKSHASKWADELMDKARHRLSSTPIYSPSNTCLSNVVCKRTKRLFKSEYLPLFEFAFEKERFPSREDKTHLARISNMSYRQVCVWFQNRRCRQASRVKSHRITPAPKTFEEMKKRLNPSTREALAKAFPFTERNPEATDRAVIGQPVLLHGTPKPSPSPEIIVLDDAISPGSSSRSVSLEATDDATSPESSTRAISLEATDDGYASDECDEFADDDFLEIPVYQLPVFVEPTPLPQKSNPLDPFKTSVHAFPAVYEPSQLTSDPFAIGQHPWLRDPCKHSRKFIDPTPEAMEDILGGFDRMDVDEPNANTRDCQSPRLPMQRNISSGSIGMWSSGESTAASQTSSYSSSVQSSPRISEAELPTPGGGSLEVEVDTPSECTLEASDYTASPEAEDVSETDVDTEAETVCESPEEESTTAGPSASLKKQVTPIWESPAEERVDAWVLESQTMGTKSPAINLKWENLLVVAAQATR